MADSLTAWRAQTAACSAPTHPWLSHSTGAMHARDDAGRRARLEHAVLEQLGRRLCLAGEPLEKVWVLALQQRLQLPQLRARQRGHVLLRPQAHEQVQLQEAALPGSVHHALHLRPSSVRAVLQADPQPSQQALTSACTGLGPSCGAAAELQARLGIVPSSSGQQARTAVLPADWQRIASCCARRVMGACALIIVRCVECSEMSCFHCTACVRGHSETLYPSPSTARGLCSLRNRHQLL